MSEKQKTKKVYTTTWWDTDEFPDLEDVLQPYLEKGWEIFKMFLVYPEKDEGYRIVLVKEEKL